MKNFKNKHLSLLTPRMIKQIQWQHPQYRESPKCQLTGCKGTDRPPNAG